jgi:hypothetical protein
VDLKDTNAVTLEKVSPKATDLYDSGSYELDFGILFALKAIYFRKEL